MSSKLKTRKPTGKVAWPTILVDGFEKSGKSSESFLLTLSEQVGRSFVCELGEPTADEYAAIGDYEIIVHDGTYRSIMEQLEAACAEPPVDGKPSCIIFDSATALDDMLDKQKDERARDADLRKGQNSLLRENPDAEVRPHPALWNDRNKRFENFVNLLRDWPGIAVIVCHGKEVAPFANGKPIPNADKVYKVDIHRYLLKHANARVYFGGADENYVRLLKFARSQPKLAADGSIEWSVNIPANGLPVEATSVLEHVVFDVLKAGREFQKSPTINPSTRDVTNVLQAKTGLVELLKDLPRPKEEAAAIWAKHGLSESQPSTPVTYELWQKLQAAVETRLNEPKVKPVPVAETKPAETRAARPAPTEKQRETADQLLALDVDDQKAIRKFMAKRKFPDATWELNDEQADVVLKEIEKFTSAAVA